MSHSTARSGHHAEIADVLRRTQAALRRAELALEDLQQASNRERRVAAMHNVVVTGRSTTFVLQNLRSIAPNFDAWYDPWQDEMRRDPLLKYLKDLRNEIEKQGREGAVNKGFIENFNTSRDIPPAPPNAVAFFLGDENGGSGWEVRLEDDTIQKIYLELPERIGRFWLAFENLPEENLGSPIADDSLENICRLYVQYLERLVDAAQREWGPPA